MSEIERIKRYITRTRIPATVSQKYAMSVKTWSVFFREAIKTPDSDTMLKMILLAFNFGMSKGYRAAKAEARS